MREALWTPGAARIEKARMTQFLRYLQDTRGLSFSNYAELHQYSVTDLEGFWSAAAAFLKIEWTTEPEAVCVRSSSADSMRGTRWFPGGRLSYAAHLLADRAGTEPRIISIMEGRAENETLSGADLFRAVARLAARLRKLGVGPLDRVAAVVTNSSEAIIGLLATNSLGAIWSSCSPDFGYEGILDRFGQVEPKVLIGTLSYIYNGKTFDCRSTVDALRNAMPSVAHTILIDPLHTGDSLAGTLSWSSIQTEEAGAEQAFVPLATDFDHPLMILFSSGTTGKPKCIVHSVGGHLLQVKKELELHSDIGPGKRLLYFTTCGWMMWNWMVGALSTGASIVTFEGSITRDACRVLWRTLEEEAVTCFGTSAKFIATSIKEGVEPAREFDLSKLESLLSTGSPLLPEHFSWVYESVKKDLHLASISGGTDICSCFMLGNPLLPVYSGEIQGPGLGMAVECWDDEGRSVRNEKGELVCTQPFPAMPVGFWRDPDQSKYREAYFEAYLPREVWRHGDFIEINDRLGIVVFGRSDATLNPGGVRIGTAEIYRQVEQNEAVVDSLAVSHEKSGDAEMILFVKLRAGFQLTPELEKAIKVGLRQQLSPRHVPAQIHQVQDIPYTRSGKKLELAVTRILQGRALDNQTAIANPECLTEYRTLSARL